MDRKILKTDAKEILSNNKDLYLYAFLYFVITTVVSVCLNYFEGLGTAIYFCVTIVLTSLLYKISLGVSYGKEISFEFDTFPRFLRTYLFYFLYNVLAFIPMSIVIFVFSLVTFISISTSSDVDTYYMQNREKIYLILVIIFILALIISIAIAIYITLKYSLSLYIASEEDNQYLTARECMNLSKNLIKGHKTEFFILQLSFIPWIFLVGITLGIAGIYVVPYQQLTYTQFYLKLKEQNKMY